MRCGDIITVAMSGDFGKPRPAVIVQSDALSSKSLSFIIGQMTTDLMNLPEFRVTIEPSAANGLLARSQIMVDRITTVRRERVGRKIGTLHESDVARLDRALTAALGLFG